MSHQGWLAKLQDYKESLAGLFHHICLLSRKNFATLSLRVKNAKQ